MYPTSIGNTVSLPDLVSNVIISFQNGYDEMVGMWDDPKEMFEVRDVGGGNRVSLADAIATLGSVSGLKPKLVRASVEKGDVRDTWADSRRAQTILGFRATTSLQDGLAREYAWMASGACP